MIEESMVTMIGSLGFPIVAFLLMFFKMEKAIEKLGESINNNTLLIKAFMERENNR